MCRPITGNIPQFFSQADEQSSSLHSLHDPGENYWLHCDLNCQSTILVLGSQGVKKLQGAPNPHLYCSLAVLAGEMGFVEQARAWFKQGTSSVRVCNTDM